MNESTPQLTVIAPAFNEEECLPELTYAITQALQSSNFTYEIILVDDASTDRTAERIRQLQAQYPTVRGLFHTTNAGQSASLATGFRHARGSLIATLDADLQNPPHEIPRLLQHLTPETDAVCGVRTQRNDTLIRRLSSRIANSYRDWITGVPVADAGCNLRIIRRQALTEILIFNGTHRFLTTLLKLQGLHVKEIEIAHQSRHAGQSKYGIGNRLWRGIHDCFAIRWYRQRALPANRT